MERGTFDGAAARCKVYGHSAVNCAKRLNQSICRLGCELGWAEGSISSIVFARWRQCALHALMGGHIGASWRIRLNRPSAAAMHSYVKLLWPFVVAALWNRAGHYIFALWFLLSSICFLLFSSPNQSRHILDVYHTSTHGVALVWIYDAGLKRAARGSLEIQDAKQRQKFATWAPSHSFVGLYLRN